MVLIGEVFQTISDKGIKLVKPNCIFFFFFSLCSASAFFVTQTLRALSRDGRTVIASIHQPSSEVFELFDRLYLLSGGKTVYFGQATEAYEARNLTERKHQSLKKS